MTIGYKWQQVIAAIGDFDADRLVARFGGECVALNVKPNTQVCRVVGTENVQKLIEIYPEHQMKVPLGRMSADEKIRMKYISLRLDEGMSVGNARRACGRSTSWATSMENRLKTGKVISPKSSHNQIDLIDFLEG